MNVSIFGGSGFLGYDFVKHVLNAPVPIKPTVYSTNAGSLTNLSRFDLDIQLVRYGQLDELRLPENTDYLVNFIHPFGVRDELPPAKQIAILLSYFRKQLEQQPNLKLIHISTMSVYEPFAEGCFFDEKSTPRPPRTDTYAKGKVKIDEEILGWTSLQNRIQLLRPTVVYGPFGIPWTDNIIKQFLAGPVPHNGLMGKIQPIWVSDVSDFLLLNLYEFNSGTYNIAGSEVFTWRSFMEYFEKLTGVGNLVQLPQNDQDVAEVSITTPLDIKNTLKGWIFNPFVAEVATPFFRSLPEPTKQAIKDALLPKPEPSKQNQRKEITGPYCREFFEEDRLVSIDKLKSQFPDFSFTPMHATTKIMDDYFRFRFKDGSWK